LFLLTNIVEAAGEGACRLGQRTEAIVKSGGRIDAAVLRVEPLDQMLASFPDGRVLRLLRVP
jgi:hypothetical protein